MENKMKLFDKAKIALEKATSIDEVLEVRDQAEALRSYHKQQQDSLDMQNGCATIKIRAERRIGEILQDMPKDKGGNPNLSHREIGSEKPLSYSELGIDKNQAHRWQTIAKMPEEALDNYIDTTKKEEKEVTSVGAFRLAKEILSEEKKALSLKLKWTDEEKIILEKLKKGEAVVINMKEHVHVVAWAEKKDLLVKIDRSSDFGNPFKLGDDGNREEVIDKYEEHYLPYKNKIMSEVKDLKGKALGCWCSPEPCHGDILARKANRK